VGCPSTREQFGPCHPLCICLQPHYAITYRRKLDSFTSFSPDESLRNIITGINANENVNVQNLFEIGKDIVQKMDGQSVFCYSHKRSLKAKTLASSKNVNVSADRSIDPALLFQRFVVVSQTGDLRLDDVMSYELCPYPTQIYLLVLLLFHADISKCTSLYFRSDKAKSYVYNIKVVKQVLGEAVCSDLLFLHAFTGCYSVSRVFGIGKKLGFQRIINREKSMKDCSKAFSLPKQSQLPYNQWL